MKRIADTGLLLAALSKSDPFHQWGKTEFPKHAPFHTCEAVLVELSYFLGSAEPGMKLVERGDLIMDFSLAEESERVLELLEDYRDRQIDLADACLVRMVELNRSCRVWTVDREDFQIYRRHRRGIIPCNFPPKA